MALRDDESKEAEREKANNPIRETHKIKKNWGQKSGSSLQCAPPVYNGHSKTNVFSSQIMVLAAKYTNDQKTRELVF